MLISDCDSTCSLIFQTVFPLAGIIFTSIIALPPLQTVLTAIKSKHLGNFNTIPFALLFLNNLAWMFYSFITRDYYLFFGNLPGIYLCLFHVLACFPLDSEKPDYNYQNLSCCNPSDHNFSSDRIHQLQGQLFCSEINLWMAFSASASFVLYVSLVNSVLGDKGTKRFLHSSFLSYSLPVKWCCLEYLWIIPA